MRSSCMVLRMARRPHLQLFWVLSVFMLLIGPGTAWAGGAVGIRYGWADVSDDLFEGSGDLGGTNLAGIHLSLRVLPIVEIDLAGEYVSESFDFDEGIFDEVKRAGDGDYEDITIFATGRLEIIGLPLVPIRGYVGGGVNVHWIDLAVDVEPLDLAMQSDSEVGWHGVVGLRLSVMGTPMSAFVEGRYMDGFNDGLPTSKAVYGGVSFEL
ncbi:MAG: hypothetical protein KAY24_08140 [Candidatus Eisenbacteria sp.]|nr:hypothetical protein [Candidatus Eisenbacteria bacterium]